MRLIFFHGILGDWGWELLDDGGALIAESRASFESRAEAQRDARERGYAVPIRRAGITSVLEGAADITGVGEAETLADAVRTAQRLRPDVIVTNVELPEGRADIAWSSVT